jgi:hypothetical protein
MFNVPVRAAPVWAATENPTEPFPVPAAFPVIVSQSVLFDAAVQPQVAPAVTATLAEPPLALKFWLVGAIPNVQDAACCVTVSVWPPAVIVPLRAAAALLDTVNFTVPLPTPDAPSVMVIQLKVVDAVHAHPPPAVTAVEPFPPAAGKSSVDGAMENVHGAAL